MTFKVNDIVKSDYYGVGEIVTIKGEDELVIGFDEYNSGLSTSEEYDEYDLPCYDDRFYGTFSEDAIRIYTVDEELQDIENQIQVLEKRKAELLK